VIDHDADVPVYQQLAAILREQIKSGELAAGRVIPSIKTLAGEHGVARGTAEKAVQVLRDEGLVHTVIGRGVFVTRG
jgi:DNA-binding GntR family transcriptional regulator